jgi:capsular exopolysaccharide synthesis family protein
MELAVGTHVLDYWRILRRRRWVVYLSVATVALVALVGSFLATPLYRASATLQIERQTPDILSFRDLTRVDYSWNAYTDFYQTQYKLLASENVARGAAARLDLDRHPAFARTGGASLLSRLRSLVSGPGSGGEPVGPFLRAARAIQAALEVVPVRNSHLVQISWVSADPALAADVANAVARSYIQFNMEQQYTTSDQATEFLGDQIGTLKQELSTLEVALQQYGESKRILSIDDESNITMKALAEVAQRRTETETSLARAEAAYRALVSTPPEALPEVQHSALIGRLKEEYAEYEAQYSERASLFKEDWPELQTLSAKMRQAKERLDIQIRATAREAVLAAEAEYRRYRSELENLEALLAERHGAAQGLKRDAVEFANLQAEIKNKRETLDTLLARQNQTALATRLKDIQSTSSNIRVVDEARAPEAPFRPNKKLNLVLGLLLGTVLGVGAAFVLEYLDNSIHSAAEIQQIAGIPTLAVVPHHGAVAAPLARARRSAADGEALDLVAHLDGRAQVSESYRELRTALLLSSPGRPPRQILVSSALPEEGKSATAVNLAIVLSQLGRRVVLVDTDLRRPRLHAIFDLDKEHGMSTFLSGLEEDPLRLAVPTGLPHLDIVTSGPVPPNPSELLNSETFAEFGRRYLDDGYDHIVYDSPPVLAVSDPVVIANSVEAVILVARAERTPRQSLRMAVDKFAQAGARPVGAVLNDLDLAAHGHAYYQYYGRSAPSAGAGERRAKRRRAGTTGTGAA